MCNSLQLCRVTSCPRLLNQKQGFCDDGRQSKFIYVLLDIFLVNSKSMVDPVKIRFIYPFDKPEYFPNSKVSFLF